MPIAQIGQRVMVNMDGFNHGGIQMQGNVQVSGQITAIDAARRLITVQLDANLFGVSTVQVPPERISA